MKDKSFGSSTRFVLHAPDERQIFRFLYEICPSCT
jgi:hypothetical protein